jgi:hypothetical protein
MWSNRGVANWQQFPPDIEPAEVSLEFAAERSGLCALRLIPEEGSNEEGSNFDKLEIVSSDRNRWQPSCRTFGVGGVDDTGICWVETSAAAARYCRICLHYSWTARLRLIDLECEKNGLAKGPIMFSNPSKEL